ncbi:MAG: flagellar hook-associated protein FlgK [Halocynthiibacter sp.]
MSISSSLSNAMSGLSAMARSVENVSSNLANANVDGYGRRELVVTSDRFGGVQISAVQREVDLQVVEDRRKHDAYSAFHQQTSQFHAVIETAIGQPQEFGSLAQRVSDLDAALIQAESRPDLESRLDAVASAAKSLTIQVQNISQAVQSERGRADQQISEDVNALTMGLQKIKDLNHAIRVGSPSDVSTLSLLDQRQQVLDQLSHLVPMKTYARPEGEIAIYTETGTALLDGRVADIEFTAASGMTPYQSPTMGLSNLVIDGDPVDFSRPNNPFSGGGIAAQFSIRDDLAVTAQAQIDSFAGNLIDRFQSASVDPSLGPADAGIFTDNQSQYVAINELGLSQRLELNALIDPQQGGSPTKIRTGLNVASGPLLDSTILTNLGESLRASVLPSSTTLGQTALSLSGLADIFVTDVSGQKEAGSSEHKYALQYRDSFKAEELAGGVDTDQEMQKLLLIENAYAANARVIQAADDMLQSLLRI